ncbi:MAG: tail fiber protein [Acidobacteriota bacterium]
MSEPMIGELILFAGDFAPRGFLPCDGRELKITEYSPLFAVLGGNTFGGDGRQTFALPDLRGRVPMGADPSHYIGAYGGQETVTLTERELPPHSHEFPVDQAHEVHESEAREHLLGSGVPFYAPPPGDTSLSEEMVPEHGGSESGRAEPHDNMQPSLSLTLAICYQGLFPSRDP